jgi:hypothetical protein
MKKFITLVAVLSLYIASAWADLATNLNPVADADIRQFSTDDNFGAGSAMVAGAVGSMGGAEIRRSLLQFDLTGRVPTGAAINSVTLTVTVVMAPFDAVNSNFDLLRLLQAWSETNVTWNSRITATSWQQPGARGAMDSVPTASSSVLVAAEASYVFPSTAALVADVQSWADSAGTNFGWLLVSENESTPKTARLFGTHEDTNNAPVLTIHYSLPVTSPPPAPPTISQVAVLGNEFYFSFGAESNRPYAVEFRAALDSGNWAALTNFPPQPTPTNLDVTDPLTGASRFYRIRTP